MKRFLAELKRRKVIQTAVLYAVASWALLQVAELLLDMLEVPAWGLKLVFVLLLIGFPLALLLSWMHQVTPEGIRRESACPRHRAGCRPPARSRLMPPTRPWRHAAGGTRGRRAFDRRSAIRQPERGQGQRVFCRRVVR